jgi:dimethylhistidine N-methyltransferase
MIARELIAIPSYAEEVETGLLSMPKQLPAKLFYDAAGSSLFEEITSLPEYYLTRTELGILRDQASGIAVATGTPITVVELGSGTAAKTCTLLRAFTRRQMRVPYFPVDISASALADARERVLAESPGVLVKPVIADFSHGFGFLRDIPGRKLVLYLGSSIGNFDPDAAIKMLADIRAELSDEDALLLGTDMVKHPRFLVPAYNDASGVTAEFNKNILRRLNSELVADFDLACFRHVAVWNSEQSRMEMHLESCYQQTVHLGLLQMRVEFRQGERIHTENSYKYTMPMVRDMLSQSGFEIQQTWFDSRQWFGLHLASAS